MNNFEFDGIQVFPLCAIKGYRDNKFERCINQILTDNNQIKRFRAPGWVKTCVGFRELASRLYKHDIWPAVEVIFEDDESAFYIGPVCEVEDDNFSIDCYDAAGQWEDTYKFEFNDVFRMEFGSKYTEHFNNYMRKQKRS